MGFSSTGYIGLAIGGCLLLCVIIALVVYCWRKDRTKHSIEVQTNVNFLHKGQVQAPKSSVESAIANGAYKKETAPNTVQPEPQTTPPSTQVTIENPPETETIEPVVHKSKTPDTQSQPQPQPQPTAPNSNEMNQESNIKAETKPTTHKKKPESMRIMLNDETLINRPFHHQSNDTTLVLHETSSKGSGSSGSGTPPITTNHHGTNNSILIQINDEEPYPNTSERLAHPKNEHPRNESSTLDPMALNGRSSIKIHSDGDSFDADADFTDHTAVDGNHGFGPSVQIHDDVDLNEVLLTDDTLPVEALPHHYLSDSVESLDPDFVLEAAYFEESSAYSSRQQKMDSLIPIPSDEKEKGSTEWTMPGVSIDHTASIEMLQSLQMFNTKNKAPTTLQAPTIDTNAINQSIQMEAPHPPSNAIGKSIQYEAIGNPNSIQPNVPKSVQFAAVPPNANVGAIGKSIQYESASPNAIGQSIQYEAPRGNTDNLQSTQPNIESVGQSIQMATASSMGGEQFIMWQMHGRKLQNMSHEKLVEWLENSGFDTETLDHFRKYKIDGRKLWQNIRNASMFLYNVGVVRPTLRDAIVQNIYLELLPKTPGFDERHMSDFKRLELIADGPISTVYRAVIKKEALKLRESIVVIKGYHFTADDVRVGKIIQILVHLVTNIQSSRFVKIHGFIRNMMDTDLLVQHQQRAMFGIVMEYCDGGSIHSMFKDGRTKQYHFEYNIMDKIGIIYEIALAMSELHKKNTLHRNLKASNVLVSNNDDIKLTDYCLDVTQLTDFTHSSDAKERSIRWMSPELIQTQTYTKACDIYSFGILCYEILSGNNPYHAYTNTSDLLRRIINDNLRPNIDDLANLPDELLILMSNCWLEDASQRPDFEVILDELDKIKEELRTKCITFDDIYARARASMMDGFKKGAKAFQSSPLLVLRNEDDEDDGDDDDNYVQTFDHYNYHINNHNSREYDENDRDDEKFEQLLAPYNENNRPTHVKDDTALELEKMKMFEPKRRRKYKKKRPRKPLPKAPPVRKELPQMNDNVMINDKEVHLPDKPLPPKPLKPN